MTEIDWSAPSREADAWIAEHVMGWEVAIGLTRLGVIAYVRRMSPDRRGYIDDVPCFTQDIAAAWELLEWLAARFPDAHYPVSVFYLGDRWACSADVYLEYGGASHGDFIQSEQETAPLAICYCAYLAMQAEE